MTTRWMAMTLVLVLGACTGGSTSEPASPPSSTPTATESPIPSGQIVFVPGEFFIDFAEVRSDLTWNGGAGELRVTNASDSGLGVPGVYAITTASTTVDAVVEPAEDIPAGGEATFTVTFPDTLDPADAGLLVLSYGEESWGAMAPVVRE